jgi:hypothetical protein
MLTTVTDCDGSSREDCALQKNYDLKHEHINFEPGIGVWGLDIIITHVHFVDG